MVGSFPQGFAFLLAFWINALLYGIYIFFFLRWVFNKQNTPIYFVVICWFGFVLSNIDVIINFYLLVQGFWFWLPKGGPETFFTNLANGPTVLREVNYQTLVIACDAFMTYRLWGMWDRNWYITILPGMLLLCQAIFGFMVAGCLSLKNSELLPIANIVSSGFNTGLQVALTFFIAFRLSDPRRIKYLLVRERGLRSRVVRCIIESGLMVTVILILDLALFASGISFHWVFKVSLTQLYAIMTVLIATFNLPKALPGNKVTNLPLVFPRDQFSPASNILKGKKYKGDSIGAGGINVSIVREVYDQV